MLNDTKLEVLKNKLQALKTELEESIELAGKSAQTVDLDQTLQGRVSRGDALQQQEMAKAGVTRNKKHLRDVIAALRKTETDDYGYCEECEEEIAVARLEVMPETRFCIPCKDKLGL